MSCQHSPRRLLSNTQIERQARSRAMKDRVAGSVIVQHIEDSYRGTGSTVSALSLPSSFAPRAAVSDRSIYLTASLTLFVEALALS